MLKREELETYCNDFAMKMYRHLVELYGTTAYLSTARIIIYLCDPLDIEDDITEEDFQRMIEDPELYGLIWEDYLIMTENIEELLLETEYDVPDLEKAANELAEMWESFDIELLSAEKPDVEEEKKTEETK